MRLLWFQVFREAVRCGSLGEASRTFGYTQSAVSRHIAALEAEYGIPLLERGPTGVRPTPYGERLVQHADAILAHDDQLRREFATWPLANAPTTTATSPQASRSPSHG